MYNNQRSEIAKPSGRVVSLLANNKLMCIIIVKQKGNKVPMQTLKNSARINQHGLGIIWLDTYSVEYHKSNDYKLLDTSRPYIAHFRYATKGAINLENTHPFNCGKFSDEFLFHNGTIRGYGDNKTCDSKALARELGGVPRTEWKDKLGKYESRFVSVNTRNRTFQIYNRNLWFNQDNIWYSKTNVIQDTIVGVYGTLRKGLSNSGHLRNAKFISKAYTQNPYPLEVSGLPYLHDVVGAGKKVVLEVYAVNKDTLETLDRLEGHPRHYARKQITLNLEKGGTKLCWVYFIQTRPFNPNTRCISDYTLEKPKRPRIDYNNYTYNPYKMVPRYNKHYNNLFATPNPFSQIEVDTEFTDEDVKKYQSDAWADAQRDAEGGKSIMDDFKTEETETKYCCTCITPLVEDTTEVSNSRFYCEECNASFTEDEVLR